MTYDIVGGKNPDGGARRKACSARARRGHPVTAQAAPGRPAGGPAGLLIGCYHDDSAEFSCGQAAPNPPPAGLSWHSVTGSSEVQVPGRARPPDRPVAEGPGRPTGRRAAIQTSTFQFACLRSGVQDSRCYPVL